MSLVAAGRIGVGARRVVLGVTLGAVLLSGCGRFDDRASSPFTTEPSWQDAEPETKDSKAPPTSAKRPDLPCVDPDTAVVVSCLDTTGGVVALPDGVHGLVAERLTGRILKVEATDEGAPPDPIEIARLDVDGSGDGGLTALALSPSYAEDGLIYAYITTGGDNRVVRLSTENGGAPKPVLTGIPKGATGNRGSIDFHTGSKMLVLTGDAGNPGAAADNGSLAGKLLGLDTAPGAAPEVMASGIGVAGGVCSDHVDSIWVTDRTATEDRLQRIAPDGSISKAWTWQDHPGVAGCAAATDGVAIALTNQKALALALADKNTHAVTAAPSLLAQDKYGRLDGASPAGNGIVWVSTVNKTDGQPNQYDDRVVRISVNPQGGQGNGPD
ncbi:PQQ-dependent sugar dehydrogenase [Nocardia yamanashiensis]|uniref:PQQ-dependent sugar dehydrogenase n=1 Tax=Nocardia yamanashiensis TaxID=209247 RepID=UPI001E60F46A|nr:PQQ-dependent sugar dehydrogenase [Nocardia yamanashiensis]UGT41986.1 PQQ-dependent sugar dehydrogenase [Nocardia yamanashiensis]